MPAIKRWTDSFNTDNETEHPSGRTLAIVDGDKKEEVIYYCPSCFESSHLFQYLGPVILGKNETIPRDHHAMLQCSRCGRKYATSEVKRESEISDIVDVEYVDPGSGFQL